MAARCFRARSQIRLRRCLAERVCATGPLWPVRMRIGPSLAVACKPAAHWNPSPPPPRLLFPPSPLPLALPSSTSILVMASLHGCATDGSCWTPAGHGGLRVGRWDGLNSAAEHSACNGVNSQPIGVEYLCIIPTHSSSRSRWFAGVGIRYITQRDGVSRCGMNENKNEKQINK